MAFKWRFSVGLIFSLTLHLLLLMALFYWYPGIVSESDWPWKEWSPFFLDEQKGSSTSAGLSTVDSYEKLSGRTLFFPDIVLHGQEKKPRKNTRTKKQNYNSIISFEGILAQVEKYPKRLKANRASKKQFSGQVVSLLSLLTPVELQSRLPEKETPHLKGRELVKYRQELNEFLSARWEVPIHLIESQLTVVIKFEINKDGRILSWKQEESGSFVLYKSVKNLLKNLQFLPSLPKSYPEDSYKFGVRFTPANFKK